MLWLDMEASLHPLCVPKYVRVTSDKNDVDFHALSPSIEHLIRLNVHTRQEADPVMICS